LLGGGWRGSPGSRFLVVERTYDSDHRHGRARVADLSVLSKASSLSLLGRAPGEGQALFVDLETTGLAGGAGAYAFLVGCAWVEDDTFRTRQYFLSDFVAERALLEELASLAATAGAVVTYNGKAFDVPLLDSRYTLYRKVTPFAAMTHIDMLHAARRLWRKGGSGKASGGQRFTLTSIEEARVGHARADDVPGFEIPSRFFHFVHTGDPRALAAVLEHNRLDLLSLAVLTARVVRMLDRGPSAATTASEALGLGRLYERAGLTNRAKAAFARAAGVGEREAGVDEGVPDVDVATRAEALRAYALLSRRERRFADAADAWQRLVALGGLEPCAASLLREAVEALAVHHEHRLRDARTARTLTLQGIACRGSSAQRRALEHRLARLERKLDRRELPLQPLFSW
jgi:hypothetical protein